MTDLKELISRCQEWIAVEVPFTAYYYPNGCGIIDMRRASKKQLARFRKIIDDLRADEKARPLYVVEYDGRNLSTYTEGGDLDALCTLSVPGDSDPVGP